MERRFIRKFLVRNFRRGNEIGEACRGDFLFEDTITYSFVNLFTNEDVISRTTRVASANGGGEDGKELDKMK